MTNLYDFDKTIYKKDCSIKLYFYCLNKKPYLFFHLFYIAILTFLYWIGLIKCEKLKEKMFSILNYFKDKQLIIENFWDKEIKNINSWYLSKKKENDIICTASPEFLVKSAIERINPNAVVIGTKITFENKKVICEKNCKGEEKVNRIKQYFKGEYKNLKFNATYTDSISDMPILDLAENKYIVCGSKEKDIYEFSHQKPKLSTKIKYLIKLMRIKHWIKNGLIFLPLIFSKQLFTYAFVDVIIATISFCLITSFVYILNDLIDVKKDRLHSSKRKRPIASFMIKPYEAILLAIICLFGGITLNILYFNFNTLILAILLIYCIVNLLYSTLLKRIPIIDVFVLSFCYIIRLFYGGVIINVDISIWLYLTTLGASLFMGINKRRNELLQEGRKTRAVNKYYNASFLNKQSTVFQTLTLAFYSLWVAELIPVSNYEITNIIFLITIPLVYFILMRYSYQIEKKSNSGNPIEVLFKDIWLVLSVILFIAIILVVLYFPIQLNLR